jgi:hypothetical protein
MIFLLVVGTLVFQNGDTIRFIDDGDLVDIIVLGNSIETDSAGRRLARRGKVSDDNRFLSIHEAVYGSGDEVLTSKVSFYDANRNLLWEERGVGSRSIAHELSGVHNKLFIVGTWEQFSINPTFSVIIDSAKIDLIKEGEWEQVVDYKVSPNGKYFLFHTRNPYNYKTWDYIYFYDLDTRNAWDYLFPTCVSCKRARIDLRVDDEGRAEVVYKNEHRIFSKLGTLEDLFLKLP